MAEFDNGLPDNGHDTGKVTGISIDSSDSNGYSGIVGQVDSVALSASDAQKIALSNTIYDIAIEVTDAGEVYGGIV